MHPTAISFDLFGTLVEVQSPPDPATAVATELGTRDVPVPDDWDDAYTEQHVAVPDGAEVPLPEHVHEALASRGTDLETVERAVSAAFEPTVGTRSGAREAVAAARQLGPVGILSNCSVPSLAETALSRSALDPSRFDAVVTSVGCGWRKPHPRAFEAVASALDCRVEQLCHVGDDPRTDGGVTDAGGTAILLDETPLETVPSKLEAMV
jgi:FMN phosphatase YigB (HAD superfamily)